MKHQPFDDHTLQLLNAAVWYVEERELRAQTVVKSSSQNKRAAGSDELPDTALTTQHKEVQRG
jgi:hypothetical protein